MKKLIVLLLMVTFGFAQSDRWGEEIKLGTAFRTTDSTWVKSGVTTTMTNADTLYSGMLNCGGKEGIYGTSFYATQTSGTNTFTVQARLYYKHTPATKHYAAWNDVFAATAAAATLHIYSNDQDSPTWWEPGNGIQYRVIQAGTGVTTVYLADFNK